MHIEALDALAGDAFVALCTSDHDHHIRDLAKITASSVWRPLNWQVVGVYPDVDRQTEAAVRPVYGALLPVLIDGGPAWACFYTSSNASWELTIERGLTLFWEAHYREPGGVHPPHLRGAVRVLREAEKGTLRERERDKLFAALDAAPRALFTCYLPLPEGSSPLQPPPWPGAEVWAEPIEVEAAVLDGRPYLRHSGPYAYQPWFPVDRDRVRPIARTLFVEPILGMSVQLDGDRFAAVPEGVPEKYLAEAAVNVLTDWVLKKLPNAEDAD